MQGDVADQVWWTDAQLRRFITDLIVSELRRLRPGMLTLPALPWPTTLDLRADLNLDSLELVALGTTLTHTLQLHNSGVEDYLLLRTTLADWIEISQAGLKAYWAQIAFKTSGSAGEPKACLHHTANLWQEVAELAPLIGQRRRIFCAVPSHHIYGFLFSILLPSYMQRARQNDAEVIDARQVLPGALAKRLGEGDLLIGYPDYWHALVSSAASIAPGVMGLTSTAPCPDSTAQALKEQGLTSLLQIYGSTETAGVAWRTAAAAPYRCMSFWQRDDGSPTNLMRRDADGAHRILPAPDLLDWDDNAHFRPAGRIDQAVQVGGINVFPARVREILLEHPDLADAAVRLMRPDEGLRLKAFIVPRDAAAPIEQLEADLRSWMRSRLAAVECPASLTFGARLPSSASGKPGDWIAAEGN